MATILFGILFTNPDTGERAQLGLETGTNHVYVRSTTGGAWSSWERLGGDAGGNDTGDDDASNVVMANMALKWSAPLTLELTGDVAGRVSFDGSEGVVACAVTVTARDEDAVTETRAEEIARRIAGELVNEHERRYDHYNTNTGN